MWIFTPCRVPKILWGLIGTYSSVTSGNQHGWVEESSKLCSNNLWYWIFSHNVFTPMQVKSPLKKHVLPFHTLDTQRTSCSVYLYQSVSHYLLSFHNISVPIHFRMWAKSWNSHMFMCSVWGQCSVSEKSIWVGRNVRQRPDMCDWCRALLNMNQG
jgi:hypothetical protein